MNVTLIEVGVPTIPESQRPADSFEGFVVAKWYTATGRWLVEHYKDRGEASSVFDLRMKDTEFGEVRLLWVSESGNGPPRPDSTNDELLRPGESRGN